MKCNVVGIGACVNDTLITVPSYPEEDTKLRAGGIKTAGGGPCATGLVAASKLGVNAGYIGVLSNDGAGRFLLEDFEKYGVDTQNVVVKNGYRSFASFIVLSEDNATRTCVFDKGDLPPLALDLSQKNAIIEADILMIDGNEMSAALEGASIAKAHGTKVLYDCGGMYQGVEELLKLTDIMIPSCEFALKITGCSTPRDAAKKLYEEYKPEVVVITCGKDGGIYYDGNEMLSYPAFPVQAVDTNGSGDVFHGAFAAGTVNGYDYKKCCYFASATSAIKCMGIGARESVPAKQTVLDFLKEKGYEL
ncbi:MAG: bifunctional hydroxymethylpyrimidine kinase/phosphomethylpyrimidine kinase [Clostridia bacterium]|nr:bifunctional hydroxymethylpyrimidine kinase/phosphomethylpyrimidine kinase [Clostridia bacterium]